MSFWQELLWYNDDYKDLKGIIALRLPLFSQGLAQVPITHRTCFGIATAHDFERRGDITNESFYKNIFASHFQKLAIIFQTLRNVFHVA